MVFPDRIFKRAVKEKRGLQPFLSLFICVLTFAAGGIYLFKVFQFPPVEIRLVTALLIILSTYVISIILTAVLSSFFNRVYSITIKLKGQPIRSDFRGNFLCHLHTFPYWMFLLFLYLLLSDVDIHTGWIVLLVCFIIRILDIEARLMKVVYKLRLIQGYVIVFVELVSISMGMGLGSLIISFRSCR